MNVNLTPELEQFVKAKVGTGLYNSASEVVRDALRLLEEQDRFRELKLKMLRDEIQKGIDELDGGKVSKLTMDDLKKLAREYAVIEGSSTCKEAKTATLGGYEWFNSFVCSFHSLSKTLTFSSLSKPQKP